MKNVLTRSLSLLLLICCVVVVIGCGDKDPKKKYDIYAFGYSEPFNKKPAYWKNGEKFTIGDGTNTIYLHDIEVVDGDVYVAGVEFVGGGPGVARYWKNGTAVSLTNGNITAEISAIAISGSDVYAVGNEGSPWKPKFWKNGVDINLPYGGEFCGATGLSVVGSNVHVIGFESGADTVYARYWKNGTLQPLTPKTDYAYLSGITSDGSDIYIAGYYNTSEEGIDVRFTPAATYWKNGSAVSLGHDRVNQIAVSGSDVYVTAEQDAAFYKNQTRTVILEDGSDFRPVAGTVSIADGDVIISGVKLKFNNERLGSYIWVNGEAQDPFTGNDPNIELIGAIAVSR